MYIILPGKRKKTAHITVYTVFAVLLALVLELLL